MTSYKSTIRVFSGITGTVTTSFSSAKAAGFTGHGGLTYNSLNADVIEGNNDDDPIYVYSGITSAVKTSFSIPKPAISFTGLAYDSAGNFLPNDQRCVYVHSGVTGTVTMSFSTPGGDWEGLTYWRSPPQQTDLETLTSGVFSVWRGAIKDDKVWRISGVGGETFSTVR